MAKRKKHILSLEPEFDFDMVGICSHHSDYRLAWNINDKLGLRLCKCDDYVTTDRKGDIKSSHSMYEFEDTINRLNYFMIKNKCQGQFLIHEKPTIDFFLFLCDNSAIEIEELLTNLKAVSSILAAYDFIPEEIASAENLAFD